MSAVDSGGLDGSGQMTAPRARWTSAHALMHRLIVFALFELFVLGTFPASVSAQRPRGHDAQLVSGSYAQPGCGLQVAPVATDSVRVQIECNRGAPSYNLGFLDEHLPIHSGTVVHMTSEHSGSCRITIAFHGTRAVVTEDGTDITCGFGAGVSVAGVYDRTSRRSPPFDLSPCG